MAIVHISIIAPVFNMEQYLERFLDALSVQDYPADRFEVIAVDNGSTDGSVAILEKFPWVTLLHEPTPGAYSARNRGIRAARGQVVAFIDPDCIPGRGWLAAIERAIDVPGREIVLGKREYDSPPRTLRRLAGYDTAMAEYVFSSDTADIYYGYTNNMAVRRSLFDTMGLFHEVPRGADTVFVRKAVDALGCASVGYDSNISVLHLEIHSAADFYRKRMIYGASNQRTSDLGSSRPLRQIERLRVFAKTVRVCGYSPLGAAELFALLIAGVLIYEFGRWRGRRSPESAPDRSPSGGSPSS